MLKLNALGAKVDSAVGVRPLTAVLQVALDGVTDGLHLAADLVVAPRLEVHFDQAVAVAGGTHCVVQNGALGILAGRDKRLLFYPVAPEHVLEAPFRLSGMAFDEALVGLFDSAVGKERVHACK